MLRRRSTTLAGLLLCAAGLLQVDPGRSFLQLAAPATAYRRQDATSPDAKARLRPDTDNRSGSAWMLVLGLAAFAHCRPGPFAGHGSAHIANGNLLVAQPGDSVDIDALTVMGQVPRRPHVRICDRTIKEWRRGRRQNSAAKQRFLVRREPSGRITIWRRQWGQRNLKSKKTPAHLRRLKYMVRIHRAQYARVQVRS
ncbi:unnamed protein product [Effrenium voratum]|nr:unnamed protein product [Effrenium voratum]